MKQLTRYLLTRILYASTFTLLILVSLFLFFDVLGEISTIGKNNFTWETLLLVVVFYIPGHAYQLLPLALLIGSLTALSLLSSGSEYAVMRTSGASSAYIARVLLTAGSIGAVTTFLLGEFVAPAAEQQAERIYLHATRSLVAQEIRSGLWVKDDYHFINVKEMLPDNSLRGIRIYEYDTGHRIQRIRHAETAQYLRADPNKKTKGIWQLNQIYSTELHLNHTRVYFTESEEWESVLRPDLLDVLLIAPEKMSALKLVDYVAHLKANKQRTSRYEIALWGKFFYPLACISMVLIALAATPVNQRQMNLGGRILLGIAVGLSFHFFNRLIGHLGLLYDWQPIVVNILPTILFLSAGTGLFYMRENNLNFSDLRAHFQRKKSNKKHKQTLKHL